MGKQSPLNCQVGQFVLNVPAFTRITTVLTKDAKREVRMTMVRTTTKIGLHIRYSKYLVFQISTRYPHFHGPAHALKPCIHSILKHSNIQNIQYSQIVQKYLNFQIFLKILNQLSGKSKCQIDKEAGGRGDIVAAGAVCYGWVYPGTYK